MEFHLILQALLREHGITAYRLAKDISVSPSLVGYWLKGIKKPSAKNLQKVADHFNVSTDYLLTGEDPKKASPSADKAEEDDELDVRKLNFALSGEVHDLSDEEVQEIVSFAKFMRQQRRLRDQNKSGGGDKKDG